MDAELTALLAQARELSLAHHGPDLAIHLPGMFRAYGRRGRYPAASITGPRCQQNCEHCGGRLLGPMHPATTPEEVCKALGVEAVFYGEVQEWSKTTTGIYNSSTVAAAFRMYGKDGALLWDGSDRQVRQDVARGGGNLGAEIIAGALGNLLLNPMTPHGRRVGGNIARKLPMGMPDNASR